MNAILKFIDSRFKRALVQGAVELSIPSLPGAAAAFFGASMIKYAPGGALLIVTAGVAEAERVYADLCGLGLLIEAQSYLFPQAMDGDQESAGERLQVLQALQKATHAEPQPANVKQSNVIVVSSLAALQQGVPDPFALHNASITLRLGESYAFEPLIEHLVQGGYQRVLDVEEPGQLAVRGGIMDLWPPAEKLPWRAEFFDVELESLRTFDPATQCSVAQGEQIWLPPCSDAGLEMIQLVDLLPGSAGVLWLEHDSLSSAADYPQASIQNPQSWDELLTRVRLRQPWLSIFTGDPAPPQISSMQFEIAALPGVSELGAPDSFHPELLAGARQRLLVDLSNRAAAGDQVAVCVDTAGTCELLAREIGAESSVRVLRAALSGGFVMPGLVVAAQPDLYAGRQRVMRRRPVAETRGKHFEHAAELQPGELVVHIDHGLGRFIGTTEIDFSGRRSEVMTLEYAGGMKIHVPVSHAHLISRYVGVAGHKAKLHNLHGKRWERDKADAERAVADMAAELLETQAKREVVEGFRYQLEHAWLDDFEVAFPWQETQDQSASIADVKRDMAAAKPMDRLVCGDAGYGKTEVAMRAAFIAVMNGRQAAVLVPTTILAEQHYESFRERMALYPIRIEVVSRLHTVTVRKKIFEALKSGAVDIVIGTHALLNPAVSFKNLGLLVIDEEQRFGVKHKERLKMARQVVDVLTMSATPIPRTLYMSMTGARDMSLLQTPPRERVAVETKVARDSDAVITSAIRQELNRKGQVFFLYNRVLTIGRMRERIEGLVPEATVAVAHGQMNGQELAAVMRAFEAGEVDVLLCTTIIESGLDIPRANTILIHRADRFGIAQLYQLRGRVGRASRRGYAWLLLPAHGYVEADARQRIDALKRHSGLSAGFNLALRDLEIRGAGNLLGAAQSGHIAAIGFSLYCQLLRRTIARFKGEKLPLLVDVALDLDFLSHSPGLIDQVNSACLPYNYVEDEGHRMKLHKRLAEAVDVVEVKALRQEVEDRYGRLPAAAERMFNMCELRIVAARKGLGRIESKGDKLYLFKSGQRQPTLINDRIPLIKSALADKRLAAIMRLVKKL
ncbi:MAG: transcription-repair coupling factor [Kiritimatiellae bacterium]|nr:transcription-repair coupling factor [Kiritimatiellia bacterium]